MESSDSWRTERSESVAALPSALEQMVQKRAARAPGETSHTISTTGSEFSDIYRQPNTFLQLRLAYILAGESSLDELGEFLELVINDHDPLFSFNIAGIFIEAMLVIDPMAALQFIKGHPSMNRNQFIAPVLTSWIRQDPARA